MLQPSPEYRQHLLVTHEQNELVSSRRKGRLKKLGYKALVAASIVSVPVGAYITDVYENQSVQAEANIDVHAVHEALDPENNDTAIVFLDGFGSTNGDIILKYRGAGIQQAIDGQLWSVGYNNANLESDVIGQRVIELAEEKNVDTLYFYGESAGGTIAMQAQAYVAEHSDITLAGHILNSAPDSAAGLRAARQEEVKTAQLLSDIPGAKYSTFVRYIGEMAFRSDRYSSDDGIDLEKAITTSNTVVGLLKNNTIAGSWLMFDQLMAIEDGNIKENIDKIGELPPEVQRPVIIYIGTAKPGYDYIVNDDVSAKNIEQYAADANIPFIHLEVPGAVHSQPHKAVDEFNTTLLDAKAEIQAAIATEENIASFNQREARRDGKVLDSLESVDVPAAEDDDTSAQE